MTRIKRIVTSETEGRNLSDRYADNSYVYDIEGKINYYSQSSRMQSILKPGTFYGSNGDSGDGYGFNTIKLIPDENLGSDQYIVIDPTAPNHIHIRAGGVQDASSAELILGAEKSNIKVTDYNHSVQVNTHNSELDNYYTWNFGNDGVLYGPAMGGLIVTNIWGAGQDYPILIGSNDKVLLSATNGEFLNDVDDPNNQIATIGDINSAELSPTPVSWTPVLTGAGFVQSSNPATGSYMHFGKLAVVNLSIPFSAATNFGTGQYSVNLPVAAAKHTDLWAGTLHNTSSSDFYSIKGHVDASSSTMTLWAIASTLKDEPFKYNYPISLDTTDLFHMSFIYETV